jgi:hypothetical protein
LSQTLSRFRCYWKQGSCGDRSCGDGRSRPSKPRNARLGSPLFQMETHSAKQCFWVAQRFQRCDKLIHERVALAAEVLMAAPPRGNTGYGVYFITASTFQRKLLFSREPMARLFVEVLFHYRDHKNYLLHEFVLMPDHFHLLISPTLSLERSLQLIKGRFSYRAKKHL